MGSIRVTRSYLQLSSPDALRGGPLETGFRIEHAHPCPIPFFRYLYTEVGRDYRWRDRLTWTDEQCALHTCTLDYAAALPNYLARGFEKYREAIYEVAT